MRLATTAFPLNVLLSGLKEDGLRLEGVRPGDIVDVVAPASRCTHEDYVNALKAVREIGLVPRVPKQLFGPSVLFSNSDQERLMQLKAAVYAPDSKLIWCLRGGYGTLRLIPHVMRWPRPRQPKILLGYSELAFFNEHWQWPTLHGPMLDRFGRGVMSAAERRQLLGLLYGQLEAVEFKSLKPLNAAAKRESKIRSQVVGGNLAVLQSGLAPPGELDPRGKILFLEDIGERPHRVDRMLTQIEQAGWLRSARAVVFGHFLLEDPKDRRQLWSDVIERFAQGQKIPVLSGLPVGHNQRRQLTLPFLMPAELKLGRQPSLRVQSLIYEPT